MTASRHSSVQDRFLFLSGPVSQFGLGEDEGETTYAVKFRGGKHWRRVFRGALEDMRTRYLGDVTEGQAAAWDAAWLKALEFEEGGLPGVCPPNEEEFLRCLLHLSRETDVELELPYEYGVGSASAFTASTNTLINWSPNTAYQGYPVNYIDDLQDIEEIVLSYPRYDTVIPAEQWQTLNFSGIIRELEPSVITWVQLSMPLVHPARAWQFRVTLITSASILSHVYWWSLATPGWRRDRFREVEFAKTAIEVGLVDEDPFSDRIIRGGNVKWWFAVSQKLEVVSAKFEYRWVPLG